MGMVQTVLGAVILTHWTLAVQSATAPSVSPRVSTCILPQKCLMCSEPSFKNKMDSCALNNCCDNSSASAECADCWASRPSGNPGDVDGMASPCYFHENVCNSAECKNVPEPQAVPDSENALCHEMQG